jgi:antibiotic biosynthesis monooxygenase (ABM) superfamily enzyme
MPSEKPRPWKLWLLTWLCIYPLINLLSLLLMPRIESWHPLLRTLLLSVLLVPLMGMLLGRLQLRYKTWLYR